jgi:GxxExxY protein
MQIALKDAGIPSDREVPTTVYFRGNSIGEYKLDLLVKNAIVVECKTADQIVAPHKVQLLNYLKATNYTLGLILNFGPTPTFKRIVYESTRRR